MSAGSFLFRFRSCLVADCSPVAVCAAVTSGLMQTACFAPLEWSGLAWVALVPLFWVAGDSHGAGGTRLAVLAGIVHWLSSIWWVGQVTVSGMLALVLYCSLYHLPAVWFVRRWTAGPGWKDPRMLGLGSVLGGACWTASEWVRGSLFTGFPWNPIGSSQVDWTALIGIADLGGVYLISFLVAWANVVLFGVFRARALRVWGPTALALGLTLAVAVAYGTSRRGDARSAPLRIGLVQPNIPQQVKWDQALTERILDTLQRQTVALVREGVDLVVWPETAMPNYVLVDRQGLAFVRNLTAEGTPILVGSMHAERGAVDEVGYYNSSLLFTSEGRLVARYDKQHLVLVGEYIPFEDWLLGILQTFSPMQGNVSAGDQTVLMQVGTPAFAPLICFEDILPYLSRDAVRAGARWLVNQTNDGWFDGTPGARQHFRLARFRCVEHRLPMVRATNSGVTAVIGADGGVRSVLTDAQGRLAPVEGRLIGTVYPSTGTPTVYARGGHWFPVLLLVLAVGGSGWLRSTFSPVPNPSR